MIAPHRIHGTDYALCVKHGKRVKVGEACPVCPSPSKPAPVAQERPGLAKVRRPKAGSDTEALLASQLAAAGYFDSTFREGGGITTRECFRRAVPWGLALSPERGFTADIGFLGARLLCEVKGMAHAAGRSKVRADVEREGLAVSLGWTVLPLTPEQVRCGEAVALIAAALSKAHGAGEV